VAHPGVLVGPLAAAVLRPSVSLPVVAFWQSVLVGAMVLCWALAVAIALWGSVRDAREAEREARHELRENPEPGPTPGIEGFMNHWAVWSLALVGLGLVLLAVASRRS
jgi:hypothetical protein